MPGAALAAALQWWSRSFWKELAWTGAGEAMVMMEEDGAEESSGGEEGGAAEERTDEETER